LLREYRAKPPQNVNRWTKAWVAFARTTDRLSGTARWIVGRHLDQIAELDKQVAQAEKRLREATEHDPLVKRLLEQEGIGEVTAWVLRAFIGPFERFNSGKQLARYCGLSPRNASSGGRQADAGLIKCGNNLLRATVIQAAHRLIRTTGRWGKLADALRGRGKPACVTAAAVGNRWVRALYHRMKQPAAALPQAQTAQAPAAQGTPPAAGPRADAGGPAGGIAPLCQR
jgi:transposase